MAVFEFDCYEVLIDKGGNIIRIVIGNRRRMDRGQLTNSKRLLRSRRTTMSDPIGFGPGISFPPIAEQALAAGKPNKNNARKIIRELYNHSGLDEDSRVQLAALYNYFIPPTPRKARNDFEWVASAVNPKGARQECLAVRVEATRMLGTDGHRLHIAPNDGREPGYYNTHGDRIGGLDRVLKVPDYDRITPPADAPIVRESLIADLPVVERGKSVYYKVCEVPAQESVGIQRAATAYGINRKYLDQALNGQSSATLRAVGADLNSAYRLDYGDRVAVIMPCRLLSTTTD